MKSNSILPHQNHESVLFVGGPLDTQYHQIALDTDHYTQKNEDDEGTVNYIYRRQTFPWKGGRLINLMIMEGVSDAYMLHLSKSIKEGMEDNLPLPVVFMCLPSVEQFIMIKE